MPLPNFSLLTVQKNRRRPAMYIYYVNDVRRKTSIVCGCAGALNKKESKGSNPLPHVPSFQEATVIKSIEQVVV